MFDFLFKRPAPDPRSEVVQNKVQKAELRAASSSLREAALAQAEALAGDESAAAEFILKCEYADARFKAAHHIHSKPLLEQVSHAMRNTDRRVAKLVQKRLDTLLSEQKTRRLAEDCISQAQQLLEQPKLTPNQVADLDRSWAAAGNPGPTLCDSFDGIRTALRSRLAAQAALQRAVIDLSTKLQKLTRAATEAPHVFTPERLLQSLGSLEQELAHYCADREAQSLPQHLKSDFEKQREHFRQTLASVEQRAEAIAAREAALDNWEGASAAGLKVDALQHAWLALPAVQDGDAIALDTRFNALIERVGALRKSVNRASSDVKTDHRLQFSEALDKLENALDSGALQVAVDQEKMLRMLEPADFAMSDTHAARLARARAELHRLQGWARWGGNVSREELLKAAEEFPAKSHTVTELAKKIGSLRERWKSLDSSAGPAGKEMWERFDIACTSAYAPVAAHFRKLSDERQANLEKARSIVADVRRFAIESGCGGHSSGEVDWKAIAAFSVRMHQLWRHLGPIDRKEKKSADTEFETAMQQLLEPLAAQREIEIAGREKMIAEASGLNPADRRSLDVMRALQERWQERAKALPLDRKDEQALWQRFRSACDAVFVKRKEAAREADADRQLHLRERETLCATLEVLEPESIDIIAKKMRDAVHAWGRIGPVPRASEQQIEKRYQSALARLQKRMHDAQHSAKEAQLATLRDKLKLCHAMEELIANNRMPDSDEFLRVESAWQALPALESPWERALYARFGMAIAALKNADPQHAALLQQNRAIIEREVLRLEIIMGIESPPELSRERLQLQVEVLQASLKTGQKSLSQQQQFLHVVALPALTGPPLDDRIERVAARIDAFRHEHE